MDLRAQRLNNFNELAAHAWLGRIYKRLTKNDLDLAIGFIEQAAEIGHLEFEYAVNRMFLDKPKPKHMAEIQELLTCANSALL